MGNLAAPTRLRRPHPLVMSVWASWCLPCRREAPLLEAAWQEHRDKVRFIGINHRDQEDAALAFIAKFGQTFPCGTDPVP